MDPNVAQTVFGAYSSSRALQVMIDNSLDKFAPLWYEKYFTVAPKSISLDFQTIIGRSTIQVEASAINRESEAPVLSRQGLETKGGEVPSVQASRKLDERLLREYLLMQNLRNIDDATLMDRAIDMIFEDIQFLGNAAHKKVDSWSQQAVSTGVITVDADNNPAGVKFSVNLGLAANQKVKVGKAWSDADADPFSDFLRMRNVYRAASKAPGKALMHDDLFYEFIQNEKVQKAYQGFANPGTGNVIAYTLDAINNYLRANKLPIIELVDTQSVIEKGKNKTTYSPWKKENVAFVPGDNLGIIHQAYAIDELYPTNGYNYAYYKGAQITRWGVRKPKAEWTAVEWNAFVGFEAVNDSFLLLTDQVSA